jgi:hypothetical protein
MTPEDKVCAKVAGSLLAIAVLWLVIIFVATWFMSTVDDGPAARPSSFKTNR